MTATLHLPHRSHRWLIVVVMVAAVVAVTLFAVAVFSGSGSGSETPVKPATPSVEVQAPVVAQHDPCSFAGPRRMAC